jgi:hypothetical protein
MKYLYITNPDGRNTHFCYSGNNQNYIRGQLNVDQDNIYCGGSIGIGVSPSYRLQVADGTVSTTFGVASYFGVLNGTALGMYTTVTNTNWANISAYFGGTLLAGRWIASVCDERIKKNMEDINDDTALQKILMIQPKTYNYIDNIKRGDEKVIGFSAQQVNTVIPEAVKMNTDFIPNVFKVYDVLGDIITTNEDLTNILSINDNIQIIDQAKEIKDSFKILEISPNYIKINKSIDGDKCFIYGKEINDFHTLSKEYIFTLNVSATQELYKLIQSLEERIKILENK